MIIWLDIETTGLDPQRDELLEVGLIATRDDLSEIASISRVIFHKPTIEYLMAGVVKEMHTKNGLLGELRDGRSFKEAAYDLSKFLDSVLAGATEKPVCAGSTVSFDRAFLRRQMPEIENRFHYRSIDVSSVKELCKRWRPDLTEKLQKAKGTHRVIEDLRDSIGELKFYAEHFMRTDP